MISYSIVCTTIGLITEGLAGGAEPITVGTTTGFIRGLKLLGWFI